MDRTAPPVFPGGEAPPLRRVVPPSRLGRALIRAFAVVAVGLILASANPAPARAANPAAFTSRLLAPDPEWQATCGARAATGQVLATALGNPAAIAVLDGGSAACSHLQWAGDLSKEWVATGWSLRHTAALAVDAAVLHGPELPGYRSDGVATVSFQATEWNAGVQTAIPLGENVGVGFGARLFRLEDPTEPLMGVGFSLGLQARSVDRSAGIALTDAGAPLRGAQGSYTLPTRWRAGVEQRVAQGYLLVAAAVEGEIAGAARGALGVAVRPVSSLELMGGFQTGSNVEGGSSVGWSTGATVKLVGLAVSYAFRQEETLGATHLIGIRLDRRSGRHIQVADACPPPSGPASAIGSTIRSNAAPPNDETSRPPATYSPPGAPDPR